MIDHSSFIRLGSSVLQWREIAAVLLDEDNTSKITVILNSGERVFFEGGEAVELWALFDPEGDWRK